MENGGRDYKDKQVRALFQLLEQREDNSTKTSYNKDPCGNSAVVCNSWVIASAIITFLLSFRKI